MFDNKPRWNQPDHRRSGFHNLHTTMRYAMSLRAPRVLSQSRSGRPLARSMIQPMTSLLVDLYSTSPVRFAKSPPLMPQMKERVVSSFVVAVYALMIFAVTLRWLPAIGAGNGFWDGLIHLILPGFAIGIGWVGYISRLLRASTLEILGENHVRMARSFGISEWHIVARYALPLAILPTVTILEVGIAWLLSSAVFVEVVFARPGIGALIVNAVNTRNYPIVMGIVLVTTFLIVTATTLSDILNAFLDPRTREKL
ncbi:ABC transporter permease [Mesorhizobium sp.]|uniref:ABC transporter permease n=1 Tax=Mesorhizobium sp. TaxID=1871066 RepID=UPI0025BE0AAF|nr:ABC transporter permease [Mesorhizobium sp.]